MARAGQVLVVLSNADLDESIEFYSRLLGTPPATEGRSVAVFLAPAEIQQASIQPAALGERPEVQIAVGAAAHVAAIALRMAQPDRDLADGSATTAGVAVPAVSVSAPDGLVWVATARTSPTDLSDQEDQ